MTGCFEDLKKKELAYYLNSMIKDVRTVFPSDESVVRAGDLIRMLEKLRDNVYTLWDEKEKNEDK